MNKVFNIEKHERFNITGRGLVIVVNRNENNVEGISVGDSIIVENIEYELKHIECFQKSFGIMGDNIGLAVKEKNINKDKYIFFWNGIYSQWHPSDFVIDDVKYTCCEQYMMAKKALEFNDVKSYNEIMNTSSPKEQKAIGRKVNGFNVDKWNLICRDVVYEGNLAKFTQNYDLYKELIATGDKIIVEASPYDKIWGIGLHESDPKIYDESQWQGTNWLGQAIMRVRTILNTTRNEK